MLRDVFYYGNKPNVHPLERHAKDLAEARALATTEHFWIVNEFCDYTNFDWDFDFEFLPDDQVWTGEHDNVWPSQHNKDSGTWLCAKETGGNTIYRQDVPPLIRTEHRSDNWILNFDVDESLFDFSWHPDPTDPPYIYAWSCRYFPATNKPAIEYHVPGATDYKYMEKFVELKPNKSNYKVIHEVDDNSFDWAWIPDPTHPPYIYVWGNQHYRAEEMPTLEFHVEGASERKYIDNAWHAKLKSKPELFEVFEDCSKVDYTWRPDPGAPPYIYAWGNQWNKPEDKVSVQFVVEGATEYKYMTDRVVRKPCMDNWEILTPIDKTKFDFSWEPNAKDPAYIYVFGNQWNSPEIEPTVRYIVPGATEIKYVHDIIAYVPSNKNNFNVLTDSTIKEFDYSWRPNPTDPPYIYVFGNQYYSAEIMPTIEYRISGATEYKYIPNIVAKISNKRDYWVVPNNIAADDFDYDWIPNPHDPPYIYEFNTQWQKNGGIKYVMPNATEVKYMTSDKIKALPTLENWQIDNNQKIKEFDFSWHPDNTEKPYIYVFGNNQYPGEVMPTVRYAVPGATEIKHVPHITAVLDVNMANWIVPDNVDINSFDFSWVPDPTSPPYIYEFATVWNDRGGPIYNVPGANEKKYITDIKAKLKPNKLIWHINISIEPDSFDFSWVPHPDAPPYIYVFGNQWNPAEKESTVEYRVPGATEYKYVNDIIARVAQDKARFKSIHKIIDDSFDFSWRPDPYDPPYIYRFGNTQYSAEVMPTVEYIVPGASEVKYVDTVKARLAPNMTHWVEKIPVDKSKFDFGWVPDPKAPPYIYVFGSQWNPGNIEHALEYHVPNATEYKYVDDIIAYLLPNKKNFKVLHSIVDDSFDFSWRPNPKDPPYIYVFGNTQYPAEKMPTVEYHVESASEYKYMDNLRAVLGQNYDKFKELIAIDRTSFDYSWTPDPHDPPYIYVWGNQWHGPEIEPTIEYRVPGAIERKFMEARPKVLPDYEKWKELIKVKHNFDFSWRPDPTSPPYIYVFGNQWNKAEVEPTLEFHVEGATDRKYITDIVAEAASDRTNWLIKSGINVDDFDFSWRPDPGSPPYIYQFGTLIDDNDGPMYVHPRNNGEVVRLLRVSRKSNDDFVEIPKYYISTTLEDLIEKHDDELFWALNKNINYSNFNFSWRPNIEQARFVHVFGSPEAKETQTYFVNSKLYKQGFTSLNFVTEDLKAESEYLAELFIQPDIFMIDRGNVEAKERFEKLQERFPNIQKTRYLNSWPDTIYRCLNRSTTQLAWILNSELDYTNFDFKYYPNPWQMKMVHVFGTQWSHWGTTYLLNKDTFPEDTKYIKIIEHLSNLNFVKNRTAKATNCLYDIYLIDHGNSETDKIKEQLSFKSTGKSVHVVPYRKSYLDTLRDILTKVKPNKENYIWVCSSVCDYQNFDMTYICDPFAKENLHVFPSDKQKFGDTFLVDVNKLKTLIDDMNLLEDYDKINYNNHIRTKRLPAPEFVLDHDTNIDAVKTDYDFPYAIFKTVDNKDITVNYDEPVCLWADHTKNLEILSTGGTILALPKEAKLYVDNELYDYPYITKAKRVTKSKLLDIVFLSNGESCAEENYQHLLKITKHLPNKVVRVDGVNGRVAAYHAAAQASNTPWMFTVFAKLKIDEKFDFSWQPDRLQIPKHYIFTAKNPVNGLVYGHQAMIAYNKKLTLNNTGVGLDFTLDDPHESVDILSGVANFNTDPYSTWRTAFREVIKLKSDYSDIAAERLNIWTTVANGEFADSCLRGAKDAVEYYDSVMGDIEELKKSYEWSWLHEFYKQKYT